MQKVMSFILVAFLATNCHLAFSASLPNLCEGWRICDCNGYNIYIRNNSTKTWVIKGVHVTAGQWGSYTTRIFPGALGSILANSYNYQGPKLTATLSDGNTTLVLSGNQNYCFLKAGKIHAGSSNSDVINLSFNKKGSFKHKRPGVSYFIIPNNS